jgi:hypothetical protein
MAGFTPFSARPSDEYPEVACIRYRELVKVASASVYTKFDEPWRQQLVLALQNAAYAAGIQTMRQQFEASQAAAQQAAAGAAQAQAHGDQREDAKAATDRADKQTEAGADRAFQAGENEADRSQAAAVAMAKAGGSVQQGAAHQVPA